MSDNIKLTSPAGGDPTSLFDIDPKSGTITLTGALDYESRASQTIYLEASDRGRPTRWSTCTVVVAVSPVNEFEPIFKEMDTISIPEDTSIGIVGRVISCLQILYKCA